MRSCKRWGPTSAAPNTTRGQDRPIRTDGDRHRGTRPSNSPRAGEDPTPYILDPDEDAKVDKPKPPDRFRATLTITRTTARSSQRATSKARFVGCGRQAAVTAESRGVRRGRAGGPGRSRNRPRNPRKSSLCDDATMSGGYPTGTSERTIAVGLLPREGRRAHEIGRQ